LVKFGHVVPEIFSRIAIPTDPQTNMLRTVIALLRGRVTISMNVSVNKCIGPPTKGPKRARWPRD